MVDASAVNYIKTQLNVGYSEEEIRKALREAGWNEKDIDNAFYVVNGKNQPVKPNAKASVDYNEDDSGGASEYESPWQAPGEKREQQDEAKQNEKPVEKPVPVKKEKEQKVKEPQQPKQPSGPRKGAYLSIIGGALILANFAMKLFNIGDILSLAKIEIVLLRSLTPELVQMITPAAAIGSIVFGVLLILKPRFDLYFGIGSALLGLGALLCGGGFVLGGILCIAGGALAIVRK
jgi:hypothetical protein